MLKKIATLLVFPAAMILQLSAAEPGQDPGARKLPGRELMDEWQSLKYGMFLHFGMATFTGRADENAMENSAEPSKTYAPKTLDVDQWIRVARDAGMKYAVLTAKHSAGHCLWDSKVLFRGKEFDHDVATSGNRTDVVAEYVKACKKHKITPGLYWCLLDFRNNSFNPARQWFADKLPEDYYQFAQDQLAELIKNYPEVSYYWLDIPRAASAEQSSFLYDMIKRLRPRTVVLFNHGLVPPQGSLTIGTSQAAWPTDVLNTERYPCSPGQFTAEQTWQDRSYKVGYEHCDCLAKHWFWCEGDMPRPIYELSRVYRDVIAGGGNLLLDVAPDREGRIPDSSVKALMQLKQAIDDPSSFPAPVTLKAKATASNFYKNDPNCRPEAALDGNTGTRWATDDGTKAAWLAVDLGKPIKVGSAFILQAYPELERVKKFAIEYRDGDAWKTCYQGKSLGPSLNAVFKPVTAQQFRLNITEASDGPTLWEFQLFGVNSK
jgi:alpha-L-fucosidase